MGLFMWSAHFAKLFASDDPFKGIIGQSAAKQQLKSALLAGRHVIIVGPPGVGKTSLAKSVAALLPAADTAPKQIAKGMPSIVTERFVRIQGSPDLTVEDLLGDIDPIKALQFGPTSLEAFTPGKIFRANGGVLFFDELNRCPEKLQNSLLQVLEEHRATIGAYLIDIPAQFIFIGTMNPEETSATERLSDVFLDRFDVIHMGYPETSAIEAEITRAHGASLGAEFPVPLLSLMIEFVRLLRDHKDVHKKPSVRATLGLYERSQANAILAKRKSVNASDIAAAILSVLSHRIELKPSVKYLQSAQEFVRARFAEFCREHTELADGGECL